MRSFWTTVLKIKSLFLFGMLIFCDESFAFCEQMVKIESKYEAKYKKDEIKATLIEGGKISTDFFQAAVFAKQNPEHTPISETFRGGIFLTSPVIETDSAVFNAQLSAFCISYDGIFSRLKNPEKLLTSSSPLLTVLNMPRGVNAHLPSISSAKQKNSVHFECAAETQKTSSTSDFTLFADDSFVCSGSETLLFPKWVISASGAAFRTENDLKSEGAIAFSNKTTVVAGVFHAHLTENALSICALGAASYLLRTQNAGVYTIQSGFFKGTDENKIKNMESFGLICDFFQNRVRIGTRAILTEKEAKSNLNLSFGFRYKAKNFATSLKLSDVLEKPSVALSVSNKMENGLRLSCSTKNTYDKVADAFSTSVKTGIRTEDCAFSDWSIGASAKLQDGELKKRTVDSSAVFVFGCRIRCIARFSFCAEF